MMGGHRNYSVIFLASALYGAVGWTQCRLSRYSGWHFPRSSEGTFQVEGRILAILRHRVNSVKQARRLASEKS